MSLCLPGGYGPQYSCTLCILFPYQAEDHLGDLHHQPGSDWPLGQPLSAYSHHALLQWRCLSHLLLHARLQLLCQHVLQYLVSHLHMRRPLPRHCAGKCCIYTCWLWLKIGTVKSCPLLLQVEASRRWRNSSVAKCVCISVWLFAIVVTYSFLSTALQNSGCGISKLIFLTITEFLLPLIIIMVFTLRIMWALTDRRLMQQSRYFRLNNKSLT